MPEIKKYKPGMLCWSDLGAPDPATAKKFYTSLFGWTFHDDPMPGGSGSYTRFQKDGRDVCALYPQRPEMKAMPPFWGSYIAVDDVDAVTNKTAGLGGKVVMPPFDVMDAGRMSAVQDPTGASLFLWQPKKHIGAQVMMEPNTLCWTELSTPNVDVAGRFYTNLLGWQAEHMPQMSYTVFKVANESTAGMMAITAEMKGVPPHWGIYFSVANADEAVKKASSLGAKIRVPATDIPTVGRFAIIVDPQGATFGILQAAPR